jgi:hypothetical protein
MLLENNEEWLARIYLWHTSYLWQSNGWPASHAQPTTLLSFPLAEV